jgi:tRNA(Ile)-lysidine synthase
MIFEAVKKTIEKHLKGKIFVGFSGGADSTALLLAADYAAVQANRELIAVHFEHGIRGEESIKDAEWCEKFCRKRHINFIRYDLKVPDNAGIGENIEAAARKFRLEKWRELTVGLPENIVLLGHHAGDRVENLFIRLCRGANSTGLAGLRSESYVSGVHFVRPLLGFSKAQLIDFLKEQRVDDWREDCTNCDDSMLRNFLRNRLLPKLYAHVPNAESGLIRAADALEADAELLEHLSVEKYSLIKGKKLTDIEFWRGLPDALLPRVLRLWLSHLSETELIPDYNLINRLQDNLERVPDEPVLVPVNDSIFLRIQRAKLEFFTRFEQHEEVETVWDWQNVERIEFKGTTYCVNIVKTPFELKDSLETAYFDADKLPEKLLLTSRHAGDRILSFGLDKEVKVKKVLTDRKLTASEKEKVAILRTADKTILWIPGVRNSAHFQISDATNRIALFKKLD